MLRFLMLFICLLGATTSFAQNEEFTYEIRYWQNVSNPGSNEIFIDTMIYHGRDRAGFDYSSADCVSYFCKDEDNMIYSLMNEIPSDQKDWIVKNFFIRKVESAKVDFRSKERDIYLMYVTDNANKDTGIGTYALVSEEFGVVFRWNSDGEIFQLLRIDIVVEEQLREQLDLTPLMDKLYMTDLFAN